MRRSGWLTSLVGTADVFIPAHRAGPARFCEITPVFAPERVLALYRTGTLKEGFKASHGEFKPNFAAWGAQTP